jgi:pterin-4a-carbinolamine dehydratase
MSSEKQQMAVDGGVKKARVRRPPRPVGKLKPERVQLELRTMPGWRLVAGGNALARTRKFTQAGAAAKWAAFIADLAATELHAIHLGVTANQVTLLLQRPSRRGIDMPLLDFARQLG